jgi:HK97 family phage portal protein
MSLFSRILGLSRAAQGPAVRVMPAPPAAIPAAPGSAMAATGVDLRDIGFTTLTGGSRVRTLPPVSPLSAQRHATVFACCSVIAGDLAKVPLHVFQRGADGRVKRVRDHALPYLLNIESVPGVAAVATRLPLVYAFVLRGNGYAYAPRDGAGEVMLIEAVRGMSPSILRSGRERFYDFEDGAEIRRRVPSRAMVHLRYMAEDGWTGRSPIEYAAESVGIAMAGQEAAGRSASGAVVKAIVRLSDDFANAEDDQRAAQALARAISSPDVDGIPLVRNVAGIDRLDLSASDIQLLESRKYDAHQICSIYRVPPSKVQSLEQGVRANVEQQAIDYLTDCLLHWGTQVEMQMGMALLTPGERAAGMFLRHDFDALLRPTTKERYEAHARAVGGPFKTVNEVRREEDLEPVDGGDVLYPPPNQNGTEGMEKGAADARADAEDSQDE